MLPSRHSVTPAPSIRRCGARFEGRLPDSLTHALAAVERAEAGPTRVASTFHSNAFLGVVLDAYERPSLVHVLATRPPLEVSLS